MRLAPHMMSEDFFTSSGLAADFAAQSRLGIYVHVPFCPHICPYCDFVKTSRFSRTDVHAYFQALRSQLERAMADVPDEVQTVTLYFGGGTPSLFPPDYYQPLVEIIRDRFTIEEFTVETNPFSNRENAFKKWKELGVQRITLGAQSLNSDVLAYLGRKHSADDVLRNIDQALASGLSNIQVDFIFGVRKLSSRRDLISEVRDVSRQGATGVSCYLLTIERSTAFANELSPDDEFSVNEYTSLVSACEELGFTQYETSNFSKSPAIHNRLYWYGLPYLGLGTGAHGLTPASTAFPLGRRYQVGQLRSRDLPGDDPLPFASEQERLFEIQWSEERRVPADAQQEMIFTLLRTKEGIPLRWLESLYSRKVLASLWSDSRMQRAFAEGAVLRTGSHLRLPPSEKIRGDSWALLLISLLHQDEN